MTDTVATVRRDSTVTITAHCQNTEHVHVAIRHGINLLDGRFYLDDKQTEIWKLEPGQQLCAQLELKPKSESL